MMKITDAIKNVFTDISDPEIAKIKKANLSYLSREALQNIREYVKKVDEKAVDGIFVETGCALGGSTILIGLTKSKDRVLNVYDVFGLIPPPSDKDGEDVHDRFDTIKDGKSKGIKNDLYYGYEDDLINKVKGNLSDFGLTDEDNINLIQGLYEDSLKIDEKVAFAHIDCDWYSSVITCLENIEPNLASGGAMIIDDYYDWSGCKDATDDYFKNPKMKEKYNWITKANKLILEKK